MEYHDIDHDVITTLGGVSTEEHLKRHYKKRPSIMEVWTFLRDNSKDGFVQATNRELAKSINRSMPTTISAVSELERIGALTKWDCHRVTEEDGSVFFTIGDYPRGHEHVKYFWNAYTTHDYLLLVTKEREY